MEWMLAVYSRTMFREYYLPKLDNADYPWSLPGGFWEQPEDGILFLEVLKGEWRIRESAPYTIRCEGKSLEVALPLQAGQLLEIIKDPQHVVTVQVFEREAIVRPYRHVSIRHVSQIRVGRKELCEISCAEDRQLSAIHGVFHKEKSHWVMESRSSNGVYINGQICPAAAGLRFGDQIRLGSVSLVFLETELAIDVRSQAIRCILSEPAAFGGNAQKEDSQKVWITGTYHRSPRRLEQMSLEPVEIEAPPKPTQREATSLLARIGQPLTMALPMLLGTVLLRMSAASARSSAYVAYGLTMTGSSALLGVFWAWYSYRREQQKEANYLERRKSAYLDYLAGKSKELSEREQQYRLIQKQQYPGPAVLQNAKALGTLWARNPSHPDFLHYRLGIGEQPFPIKLTIPKETFSMGQDDLMQRPRQMAEEYRVISSVPILCKLEQEPVWGIIGDAGAEGRSLPARLLLLQIAANNCYTDTRIALLYNAENEASAKRWSFVKWLPHVWTADRRMRYVGGNAEERAEVLLAITEQIRKRMEEGSERAKECTPHFFLFAEESSYLEEAWDDHFLEHLPKGLGITILLLAESAEELPNPCRQILENDASFRGMYRTDDWKENRQPILFDPVKPKEAEVFARGLAGVRVIEPRGHGSIPETVAFLDLYHVREVRELRAEERWLKHHTWESLEGCLGWKEGQEPVVLNLHEKYHGPHGLLAGTTGSGKSETLQTLILSLAINYSPEEVGFFLIDYKGGGMANLFCGLPHLIGTISNLSGGQSRRAMVSIKSENRRRQRIFGEYGVNHIDGYTRLFRSGQVAEPIPHLLIVIDEFAELKKEEPEFMKELISVAQVGRSLGVHLILATQKPGGVVDENIRSNARFRICLRVQDRQDSTDLLGVPDAAYLTQTGRGYLQVGNGERYEEFQSGYSGAFYTPDEGSQTKIAELVTRTGHREGLAKSTEKRSGKSRITQLEAVRDYLRETAGKEALRPVHKLWLPKLRATLFAEELPTNVESNMEANTKANTTSKREKAICVPLGLIDHPEVQEQRMLSLTFPECGHVLILGGIASGKSTMLQTILYELTTQHSPEEIQILGIDCSNGVLQDFREAPQVIEILNKDEQMLQRRAFCMIREVLEERRALLQGGSFPPYGSKRGQTEPLLLLIVDNYAGFRENSKEQFDAELFKIAREGAGLGILLLVTGNEISMNEVPGRLAGFFQKVLCLSLPDKYAYSEALRTMPIEVLPEPGIPGRGLILDEGGVLEFQTALATAKADPYERAQEIRKACEKSKCRWPFAETLRIPRIPEPCHWADLQKDAKKQEEPNSGLLIPVGYEIESAHVAWLSLAERYCLLVTGERRSGKKNFLKLLLRGILEQGGKGCILEFPHARLSFSCESTRCVRLSGEDAITRWFGEELTPLFRSRNERRREALDSAKTEEQVAAMMEEEPPLLIVIADLLEFFKMAEHSQKGMKGFVEHILDRGVLHRIYFAAAVRAEDKTELVGYPGWRMFSREHVGIHFGGQLQKAPGLSFEDVSYQEQTRIQKPGVGYLCVPGEHPGTQKLIIPRMEETGR